MAGTVCFSKSELKSKPLRTYSKFKKLISKSIFPSFFLLSFFVVVKTAGQPGIQGYNLVYSHFTENDGISHKQVNQTFQDSRGLLWLITTNGLNVFDGRRSYLAAQWPPLSFRDAFIRAEDRKDIIWVRFFNDSKLYFRLFDVNSRKEYSIHERLDTVLVGNPVDVSTNLKGDLLLINTRGELWKEQGGKEWKKITSGLGRFNTFTGNKHHGSLTWLTTYNTNATHPGDMEALSINKSGQRGNPVRITDGKIISRGPEESIIIFGIKESKIVFGNGRQLKIQNKTLLKIGSLSKNFLATYDDKKQRLFFWENDTVKVYRLFVDSFQNISSELLLAKDLMCAPFDITLGAAGEVFISSADGLFNLQLIPNLFRNYFNNNAINYSRRVMMEARGILEASDGSIYFAVGNGIYRKLKNSNVFNRISSSPLGITYLAENPENKTIWFGNIYCYEPELEIPKSYSIASLVDEVVTWSMAFIDSNTILLGTSAGIFEFSTKDNNPRAFKGYNGFNELKTASVYHIQKMDTGEWWILADNGVYVLESGKGITGKYGSSEEGAHFLPAANFRHIHRDASGIYWFATGHGLLRWDKENQLTTLITTVEGLPNNNIYGVYGDSSGFLWMSSDKGIIRYHIKSGAIQVFLDEDGISHNEFNRISHFQAIDGTIFFGSINGVTAFHPDEINATLNTHPGIKVELMSITATFKKKTPELNLLADFFEKGEVILPAAVQLLKIKFTVPNYRKSKQVIYRYRIDGLEENWVYTASAQLQLLGLGSGKHTLFIEAITETGKVPEALSKIEIQVHPPFYFRGWFLFFMLVILIFSGFQILKYRQKVMIAQKKLLEEKVNIQTLQISKDKELIEKQAEILRNQNESQRRFFANITHEFRTPLSLVIGPIEVVQKQAKFSRRYSGLLEIAGNNSKRVLDLVDSILTIASLDAQQFRRREEPTRISSLLYSLTEEFMVVAKQKQVTLNTECAFDANNTVILDQRIFRIIFNNLLSNSVKCTPAGGKIWVKLAPDADSIVLTVEDNGRGISPEDLPRIFDRFFQTSLKDAPLEGGTGIGLALVRELAELSNGTVSAQSEFGKGALFTVRLPLIYAVEDVAATPAGMKDDSFKPITPKNYHKPNSTILLVEDNADFQQYLNFLLSDYYHITHASNGREALKILRDGFKPDLILTDWMMPEMDGFQLAQCLKSAQVWCEIPLIFLTARSATEDFNKVMRLGLDDYLIKPVEESTLLTIVGKIMERHQIRKEERHSMSKNEVVKDHVKDQEWLDKLEMETQNRLSDELFSVDILASVMLMGRTNFFKAVKRLTGLTPNEYILEARLVRARQLMETRSDLTLKKVVKMIGLRDEGNFSKAFKKRFGQPPTWYL